MPCPYISMAGCGCFAPRRGTVAIGDRMVGRNGRGGFPVGAPFVFGGLAIFTGMAVIADFAAFGPGQRDFAIGASDGLLSFWTAGGELSGRIAFGLSGIFLTTVAAIGWWNYLRGTG
jgi:hypothetical protein